MSRQRITGTVEEAILIVGSLLGRRLPRSFRDWLLKNNRLDLKEVHILPVREERDTRKTWESIAYNLNHEWAEGVKNLDGTFFSHLLPFADPGNGDYYCFDYMAEDNNGEWPVVLWRHKPGDTKFHATDFYDFK